jgi:hypothetical protein
MYTERPEKVREDTYNYFRYEIESSEINREYLALRSFPYSDRVACPRQSLISKNIVHQFPLVVHDARTHCYICLRPAGGHEKVAVSHRYGYSQQCLSVSLETATAGAMSLPWSSFDEVVPATHKV